MMREADRLAFEDRVLAHFEGALDDASSERLLQEVASDPEKQQIFSEHQELDKLIMTARVPLETPEETRRSIAAVIPGLTTYLPELITTGTTVSLLATRWRAVLDFFTQTPLRTALSIGGAAAVLTTGVIVTKNITSQKAADHVATSRVESMLPPAPSQSSAQFAIPNDAANAAARAAHSAKDIVSNFGSSANARSSIGRSNRSLDLSNAHNLNIDQEQPNLTPDNATRNIASNGGSTSTQSSEDMASLGTITSLEPRSVAHVVDRPKLQNNPVLPFFQTPRAYHEPIGVTVTLSSGTRVAFKPSINGEAQSPDLSMPVTASLRVPLSEAINLLAEGGQASFVRVRQTGALQQSFGSLQHFVISTQLLSDNAYWTRVGAEYQFVDDASVLTPFVTASAGVAFTEKLAPMLGVSTGLKWYWSEAFKLIGSVGFDQSWVAREKENFTVPSSAIVDVRDLRAGRVSNSAVTVNLGFSVSF